MPNRINDKYYSFDDAFFHLHCWDEERIRNLGIPESYAESVFSGLGMRASDYNSLINKGWFDDDIVTWCAMLSLAIRFRGSGTYRKGGYIVKINDRTGEHAYRDNYSITVNGVVCFELIEICSDNNVDHYVSFINLGFLDRTIKNDWDDVEILDALYPQPKKGGR